MAILGLLLLLSAAGLAVEVVVQNTSPISVDAVRQTFSLTSGWLFMAGVATGAAGLAGLAMLVAGVARSRRHRAALVESRSSVEGLQAERDRLAVQLQRERNGRTSTTAEARHDDPAVHDDGPVIDLADDRQAVGRPPAARRLKRRGTGRRNQGVASPPAR